MAGGLMKDDDGNLWYGSALCVRPAMPSNKISLVEFSNWITCVASQPTTPQALNPQEVSCISTVDSSYADATSGKMFVMQFKAVQSSILNAHLFLGIVQGANSGGVAASATYSGTTNASAGVRYQLRVRPIIATFNIASLDWSNVVTTPILTFGATSQLFQMRATGANSTLIKLITATTNVEFSMLLSSLTDSNIYGLAVDIQPIADQTIITAEFAGLIFGNNTNGKWTSHASRPRLIPTTA
jgi:hypothetical protein